METVEFLDVEVLDEVGTALLCQFAKRSAMVPSLHLQPGTRVAAAGIVERS